MTITAPLDRRRPGNERDRIRVRNLVADARTQVLTTAGTSRSQLLVDRLDRVAAGVELDAGAHGVVIVATPERAEAHLLPFPVRPAVALGSTPATRYLDEAVEMR